MVNARSMRTGAVPLQLAAVLSKFVNAAWADGSFIQNVTPITKDLLQFWDPKGNFSDRKFNFNEGQWQALLNTIYVHEILKVKNVKDLYKNTDPELLAELDILELNKEKYSYPKYFIKMATGTGKTWVLNALLIWQYLNAKYEENASKRYSKNFLLLDRFRLKVDLVAYGFLQELHHEVLLLIHLESLEKFSYYTLILFQFYLSLLLIQFYDYYVALRVKKILMAD